VIFTETKLSGAFVVDGEPIEDARGHFARTWCQKEARAHGIDTQWVQCNISHNRHRGTLRGMHYQFPDWEAKLVQVTQGAILDVIVDLRPESPTFRQHFSVELRAADHRMLYIPEGFAHGFLSLEDETTVFYHMSAYYAPGQDCGFRWDDPTVAIPWPTGDKILSERDKKLPVLEL
jgi:dTDP-4-dehydrorhamnose 3,5-epimerase